MRRLFYALILFSSFLVPLQSSAKKLPVFSASKNMDSLQVDSMVTVCNDLLTLGTPPTDTIWKGNYNIYNAKGKVILSIKKNSTFCLPDTFSFFAQIRIKYWTQKSIYHNFDTTLRVTYNKNTGYTYNEKAIYLIDSACYIEAKILSISNANYRKYLYLETQIEEERFYTNFNPTLSPTFSLNYISSSDEIELNINNNLVYQTDEYDIEWTFISSYTNGGISNTLTPTNSKYDFVRNSSRVTLTGLKYKIANIFDKGYVLFRVRAVGYGGNDFSHRVVGNWSIGDTGNISGKSSSYKEINSNTSTKIHQATLGWQYTMDFAEEGRKKELISYFDGSMRSRQTVTRSNTDNTAIVAETIYDFEGRPAVSALPAPAFENIIKYFPSFNINSSGNRYSYVDFEQTSICEAVTDSMKTTSGASKYYSSNNPLTTTNALTTVSKPTAMDYVPVAFGYPFTQTVYLNDNTGRVKKQGGVGINHQIGSGHETEFLYATPFQDELDRLFGNEVGFFDHYKKTMTIDPNGQASVSYSSASGNVIATGLSATTPNNVEALSSNTGRNGVKVNLIAPSDTIMRDESLTIKREFLVEESGKEYKLYYSLIPEKYYPTCNRPVNMCYDCVYDLEISLVENNCGNQIIKGGGDTIKVLKRQISNGMLDTVCSSSAYSYSYKTDSRLNLGIDSLDLDTFMVMNLNRGSYTLIKKLTVNADAYQFYWNDFLKNRVCKTKAEFEQEAISNIDTGGCEFNCATCFDRLGTQNNYLSHQAADKINAGYVLTATDTSYFILQYNANKTACENLCENEHPSPCSIYTEVIRADVSPGGQYAKFVYDETSKKYIADNTGTNNYFSDPANTGFISYKEDTYFNGDSVLLEGVKTAYKDLTVDEFIHFWEPSFADHLMQYHPEYCKYEWCITNKKGFEFDKNFLSTENYQEAIDSGFLNPLHTDTLSSRDPFFKTSGSGTVLWNYMRYKLDTNYISNATATYSIREIPISIIFCDDKGANVAGEIARRACVTQYMDSVQNCKAYQDGYWKYFRSFYFSVKQQMMDSLRKQRGCNDANIGNYKIRFPETSTSAANNPTTMQNNGVKQIKDSCATTCYAYREVWREKLRKCLVDTIQMELILDSLVQVCSMGCDYKNPFGSSNVAPQYQNDTTVKFKTFKDVLTKVLSPTNIFVPGICDVTLIQMPPKYGHDIFSTLSPFADTCSCNQISSFKNGTSTCTDTLTVNNNCPCTQATANKPGNQILKLLADNEEKYKCNSCIGCDRFRNVYQAFYNVYDTFNLNKFSSQTIFTSFMNDSLGFNLSFKEYADFAAACLESAYDGINPDTLFAKYRSYYIVYKNNTILLGYETRNHKNFPYNMEIAPSRILIAKETNDIKDANYTPTHFTSINSSYLYLTLLNDKEGEITNQNNTLTASIENTVEGKTISEVPNEWKKTFSKNIISRMLVPAPAPPAGTVANLDSCGCDKILLAVKEFEAKKNTDFSYLKDASQYFAGAYNNYHELSSFDTLAKICCRAVNGLSGTINFAEPEPCVLPTDWAPNQWTKSTSGGATRSSVLSTALQNNFVTETMPSFMKCETNCVRQLDKCGCDKIISWYEKFKNDSTSMPGTTFATYFNDSVHFDINNIDTLKQMCLKAFELSQEPDSFNMDGDPIFSNYPDSAVWNGESVGYLNAIIDALPNAQKINIPSALSCYSCETTSVPWKSLLPCSDIIQLMNSKTSSLQDSALKLYHFADTAGNSGPHGLLPLFNEKYDSVVNAGGGYDLAFQVARKMQNDSIGNIIKAAKKYEDSIVTVINDSFNKAPFFNKFYNFSQILEHLDLKGCLCSMNEDQINALPPLIRAYLKSETYSTHYTKNLSCNSSGGYGSENPIMVKQCQTCYIPDPLLLHIQNYLDTLTHHAETLQNGIVVNKLTKTWWRMFPKYKKYYQTPLYGSNAASSLKYRVIALTDNRLAIRMFDSVSNSKEIELVFAEPFKRGNFLTIRKFFGIRLRNDLGCDTQAIKTFSIYAIVQRPGTLASTGFDTIYMTGKTSWTTTAKSVNCCLKLCNKPITKVDLIAMIDPCKERIKVAAKINAQYAWQRYTDSLQTSFRYAYYAKCLRLNGNESFQMRYNERQYHYTLYYYDQSGNLVKTVPPAGVAPLNQAETDSVAYYRDHNSTILKLPTHGLVTHYRYNTLNQITWQQTPDAGESKFYYDFIGRLAVSQNAKQAQSSNYSYSLYDNLGRMKEVGEIYKTTAMSQSVTSDTANLNTWLNATTKRQITNTYYDQADYNLIDTIFFNPENLRSRVTHITYKEFNATSYDHAVHYSYDIHGNVKKLLREIPSLKTLGQEYKLIDYNYDLLSGKVNSVCYQKGEIDEYIHSYKYDEDLRLVEVRSGPNNTVLDLDAKYYYYMHGPLSRTELGQHQVQGIDYAYTIQGWLKGTNASTANVVRDMGKDGNQYLSGNENAAFAKDVFGFTLSYFEGDYKSTNTIPENARFEAKLNSSAVGASAPNLFNGNIRLMTLSISQFGNTPMAYAYKYDQLNRLMSMNAWNNYDSTNNLWNTTGTAINDYHNRFTYDANGNILTQVRRGNSTTLAMDSLGYQYYPNTNRLRRVTDGVTATNYTDDIDSQTDTNYRYDAIGNLVRDTAEQIDTITWNVYGKITSIKRIANSTKPDLAFQYSPDGHRVVKIVIPKTANSFKIYTYYIRDVQGNIMATYERNFNKIIDYDSIKYKGINDTIIKVVGISTFGTFISNTYSNNNNLADSLYKNALDSSKSAAILVHLNLYDYVNSDLNNHMNSIIDQYEITNLINAVNAKLFNDNSWQQFLVNMCNNGVDITNFMMQFHFNEYMQALYNSDPVQFENMFVNISGTSWTDFNQAMDWYNANSNFTTVRDWLNSNWPNNFGGDCNTRMGIIAQIQPTPVLENYISEFFQNNVTSFKDELKSFYSKTTIYNLLYNYNQSVLQTVILATFNNNTILQWYKTNQMNNFIQYAVTELKSRAAVWQQVKATHSMEQYFGYIKTYFGQASYDNILLKYFNASKSYLDSFNLAEWHIYGSSRVGIYNNKINLVNVKFYSDVSNGSFTNVDTTAYYYANQSYSLFNLQRGAKRYELTNHLGNVLVVVSDKKIQVCSTTVVTSYTADVVSANDYSAFHATLPGRSYTAPNTNCRFGGSNGQEKDDEIFKGVYTAQFWEYDSRLGRRWNVDPVKKSWQSDYSCLSNTPIWKIDPNGDDDFFNCKGKLVEHTNTKTNNIYVATANGNVLFAKLSTQSMHNRQTLANIVGYYAIVVGVKGAVGKVGVGNYPKNEEDKPDPTSTNTLGFSFKKTGEIYINAKGGGINPDLSNSNNLKSVLVHEKEHTENGIEDESNLDHAGVYLKQAQDTKIFSGTTSHFQNGQIGAFGEFLKRAFNDDKIQTGDFTTMVDNMNTALAKANSNTRIGYTSSENESHVEMNYSLVPKSK